MNISISFHVYLGSKWSRLFSMSTKESKEKPLSKTPFINKARAEIEKASNSCSNSTNKNRTTAINTFLLFLKDKGEERLSLDEMTTDHIKAFERWSLDKGQKLNYVRCNLRNLRALINRINGRGQQLFNGIHTSNAQTVKRAVDEKVIKKLEDSNLNLHTPKGLARDIFLFCFYAMGIPLVDAAHLKKSQLKNEYIIYYRQKTHRMVKIKVAQKLKKIIERITPSGSPYLLPILTSENQEEAKREYLRFLQKYNRTLARLSKDIHQKDSLTSYTPRHSWASIAFRKGVNINVISQALGHANTRTTQSYICELNGEQLDEANMTVIQSIS